MDDTTPNLTQHKEDREQKLEQLQRELEEAKRHHPVYLDPWAADALQRLAAAVGAEDQQGQASISALCVWLAGVATRQWPETVAALKMAEAGGGSWHELAEIIGALFQYGKDK